MKRCSVLLIVLTLLLGLSACKLEERIPTDGIWYCAELKAQLMWDHVDDFVSPDDEFSVDESENYVVVNGDRIAALWGNDRGSIRVDVVCQEPNHPDFYEGETIYRFNFVSLSDTEYVLEDDTGKQYTFVRIGDTPTDD